MRWEDLTSDNHLPR